MWGVMTFYVLKRNKNKKKYWQYTIIINVYNYYTKAVFRVSTMLRILSNCIRTIF